MTRRAQVWHVGTDDVRMRIPLLLALRERGFDVAAIGSEKGSDFGAHGIPYRRYSLKRGLTPGGDMRAALELYFLFRKYRPDIMHAFDTKPTILAPVVAKLANIKGRVRTVTGMGYVFSTTSLDTNILRPLYRTLQRFAGRPSDMTIFQNRDDRDYFIEKNLVDVRRQALILGSGINCKYFGNMGRDNEQASQLRRELDLEDKIVVTMISRLVRTKGVLEYIRAARIVRSHLSNVRFLLIGPISSEGRQAVSRKELEEAGDVVHYLGQRRDVAELLALTDIFVLPSYYREGVPRVLMEAGAMGLPLITTDMPGCREVVRDGWNGYLVSPREVSELSAAIIRLAESGYLRSEMGARSKAHLAKFDIKVVADGYAEVYRRVLAVSGALSQGNQPRKGVARHF